MTYFSVSLEVPDGIGSARVTSFRVPAVPVGRVDQPDHEALRPLLPYRLRKAFDRALWWRDAQPARAKGHQMAKRLEGLNGALLAVMYADEEDTTKECE